MKKIVSLLMALALVLTFACASAADYPAKEDNVSYDVMIRMRPMNGDADQMRIFTQMEEKTNVHINFEQIPQAEWDDKISLLLGAGVDLPDALYSGYSMDSANLVKYGSQGILISLNAYIDEYMPNFKKMLDEHPEVKAAITAPDGNIYSLPFVRYDGLTGKIPGNLFMNKTWLEKLNLKVPTTIEELETVLTAFKENDCNGNGEADEIPMTFKFLGSQRDLGSLFGMFGYADSLYDDTHLIVDDGKVIYVPTTEGYKEACKYLYEHFFSKGLIDLEGFTMDKATYNAQNQGEVANIGSFFAWNVFDLGQVHMDEYEAIAPMTGPDGKCSWYYNQTYGIEPVGLVITNACKNPEHLLQWADLCYDFYYGMQLEYGCIGETLIDNGDGTYSYAPTPEGQTYDEFVFGSTYPDSCLALTDDFYATMLPIPDSAQAKDKINNELYLPYATTVSVPNLLFSEETTERLNLIGEDIKSLAKEKRAAWLAYGGVEEEWDAYLAQMETSGLAEYIQIYQDGYDVANGK